MCAHDTDLLGLRWCARLDSNQRSTRYERAALAAKLRARWIAPLAQQIGATDWSGRIGQGGRLRSCDLSVPGRGLYQTELHPAELRAAADRDRHHCFAAALRADACRRSARARNISIIVAQCDIMNELLDSLRNYEASLRESGATGLFLFGSRARGTDRGDSDLDLFIDYDLSAKVPNMFRLMQIEERISRDLGIPVTITTRNALHPLMKDSIERDAIRVL
jgi:predicted nucleotidyltransferase